MTLARNVADQERLIELVRQALAHIDAGEPVDVQVLTAAHPHLAQPLAEVLGLHEQLPALQQVALREDPLQGAVLAGRYQLDQCLGRGAMGVVYEGRDRELQRTVAVKILDVRLFRDPEAERRFQREAEALAGVQHAHVVAVFDRGRTPEGIHFLVMERLVGGTFARLLERIADGEPALAVAAELSGEPAIESVWSRQVARWGAALARGLAAAHAQQLVHRDVKPSNVFLARPGRAVLLDFGIAARANDQRLTATATTVGTPWYMAPEQVRAGSVASAEPTLDVYGLGATLFHLLAGRPPYEGDAPSVLAALPNVDPPLLLEVCESPRDLAAIVDRCLQRQPDRRYATADALATDLEAFLQHRPVTARPLGPLARRWRTWKRAPARLVAVVALVLITLVLAIAAPIVLQQRAVARVQAKADLLVTLPSVLAVEGWPQERLVADLVGEHRVGVDLLDRILELDADDLALRLFRACLRLDLGDRAGAAADLAVIAAQSERPYLRQLAQRYSDADQSLQGARAVDLTGLPEPVDALEWYVAGFHELRNSDVDGFAARADALLAKAAPEYLPARDLRLLSLAALAERQTGEVQAQLLRQLHNESVALETLYGGATARTCAMRGVGRLLAKEYRAAIPDLLRSLELRPGRHGPHQNLGLAYLRVGDHERSAFHLEQARLVRPFAWNTAFTEAQLLQAQSKLDEARAATLALTKTGQRGEAWKVPDLLGNIEIDVYVKLSATQDPEMRVAAERAASAYAESLAARDRPVGRQKLAIAQALQSEQPQAAVVAVAKMLMDDPDSPVQLANLAYLLPLGGLSAEQTAWVAAVLRKAAWQRAGEDRLFRERMMAEIDVVLRPWR